MADNEQKALQLMAEAEKKLTTQKGFFGSLFGCVLISMHFTRNRLNCIMQHKIGVEISKIV